MLDAGSGTILFTTGGAAINPYPLRAGVGISFAGEVAYARMLHDELRDRGIHWATPRSAGGSPPAPTTSPQTSPRSSGATTPSGPRFRSGSASTERETTGRRRFGGSPGGYV